MTNNQMGAYAVLAIFGIFAIIVVGQAVVWSVLALRDIHKENKAFRYNLRTWINDFICKAGGYGFKVKYYWLNEHAKLIGPYKTFRKAEEAFSRNLLSKKVKI
jgi:hypothetical protein